MSVFSRFVATQSTAIAAPVVFCFMLALAGCGTNGNNSPTTTFSGQVFSNESSRGRAPIPLAGAAVSISHYSTGEILAGTTTDLQGGFTATIRTLPPGTLVRITATAGGRLSIHALVPMPTEGRVVRADPESTIAFLGIERLVSGGAPRSVISEEVLDQALNAVRAAAASGILDLDAVDFRDESSVTDAVDAAFGAAALVTSNAFAKVFVNDIDTGRYVPYLATGLTPGTNLFRVETSTRASETSVNIPAGTAAWVDITVISGGGKVPDTANYGGAMPFSLNDELIQSPAAGLSVQTVPGFPRKRLVTISLSGVNNFGLNRAILVNVTAEITGPDTLAGSSGVVSGSKLRADYYSGSGTITQFSESVSAASVSVTFNSDGTVSFAVNANGELLTGSASGTLPKLGP